MADLDDILVTWSEIATPVKIHVKTLKRIHAKYPLPLKWLGDMPSIKRRELLQWYDGLPVGKKVASAESA